MDNSIKVTRCPRCGSVHLEGIAGKSTSGKVLGGMLLFGFIGAVVSVFKALIGLGKGKKNHSGYWKCLDCGTTFPME